MRKTLIFQLALSAGLFAAAAAVWVHRDKVEAATSAMLGLEASDKATSNARRGRRGGGALPVVVAPVGEGRNDVALEAIGTARARRSVTIFPPIAGEIVKSSIRTGMRVAANVPLVALDAKKAELAIQMARSKVLDAERKLGRSEQLRRRNVSSRATVDDARTAYERAQVELSQAQETLKDLTVRAPFAGVLGIPKVETGDRVTSSTALVTLDDREELIVEFEVPERYLPRLEPKHPIAARTPGFPRETFMGAVRAIDSRVDPSARTVKVRAAIPNKEDKLRPGMSFAVEVRLPGKPYPAIPELALQFSQNGNYVWAVEDGKVAKVPVKLVRRVDSTVLIDGPLKTGALIVIEGVQRLRPGRKVRFAEPPKALAGRRQAVN